MPEWNWDPTTIGEKVKKHPWIFVLGVFAIGAVGLVYHSTPHIAKRMFERSEAAGNREKPAPTSSPERSSSTGPVASHQTNAAKSPTRPQSEPSPAPTRAPVPPPAAPQQAFGETPSAPVAPRAPEPPLPCAHVTLPIKPAALATSADRVCAIAVCIGQPTDAPAIDAVRKWLALARAKAGAKCDVADREALGDDAVLKRLLAIAATEPVTKNGTERLSCFDAREAINDEFQKASEKLATSIDDAKRCGAKAQKEASDAVSAVVQALQ